MSEEKVGLSLVDKIVDASDKDSAILVLKDVADLLHISDDYNKIRAHKDDLDQYKVVLANIKAEFSSMRAPYDMDALQHIRMELSFLYSDIVDSGLVYHSNRLKMQYEYTGKTAKAQSYKAVKSDEQLLEEIGKSQKAIELAAGDHESYTEWSRCNSSSYGLFCDLRALQESITLLSHSVSSLINSELVITKQDIK